VRVFVCVRACLCASDHCQEAKESVCVCVCVCVCVTRVMCVCVCVRWEAERPVFLPIHHSLQGVTTQAIKNVILVSGFLPEQ